MTPRYFIYEQVVQFDSFHITTIGICLFFFVSVPLLSKCLTKKRLHHIALFLVSIGFLQEVVDYSNRIIFRNLSWSEDLPLHICNYMLYVGLVFMITRDQFLFEFLYLVGFGAAFVTIFTPEFKMINTIDYVVFFVSHGLIVVFALWGIFIFKMRPRKNSVLKVFLFLWALAVPIGLISWMTGGNYMFLMEKPQVSNPLVFGEWPWYILNISGVALIIMSISYFPFFLKPNSANE